MGSDLGSPGVATGVARGGQWGSLRAQPAGRQLSVPVYGTLPLSAALTMAAMIGTARCGDGSKDTSTRTTIIVAILTMKSTSPATVTERVAVTKTVMSVSTTLITTGFQLYYELHVGQIAFPRAM